MKDGWREEGREGGNGGGRGGLAEVLKALTHGIYAINKLPRQLPRSSDVVYTVSARMPLTRHAHCAIIYCRLANLAAKTLAARERHYDFITFLGNWLFSSIYSPYTVRQCL